PRTPPGRPRTGPGAGCTRRWSCTGSPAGRPRWCKGAPPGGRRTAPPCGSS
ncbi:hypothetical protein GOGPGP_GOGPGP_14530, partial [Dysosmobacter welbionis]